MHHSKLIYLKAIHVTLQLGIETKYSSYYKLSKCYI